MIFYTHQLENIQATVTFCLSKMSKPSAPADYVQNDSTNHNYYSYAFGLPNMEDPGDFSLSEGQPDLYDEKKIYTAQEITEFVMRDMEALDKSVRVVDSPEDKRDGTWADKPEKKPSRWGHVDGTDIILYNDIPFDPNHQGGNING